MNKALALLEKHSAKIFTTLAIGSSLAAIVTAVKATPKAQFVLAQERGIKGRDLTTKETVLVAAHCYSTSAVLFSISFFSIIGVNRVHVKRHAAAMSAYVFAEEAFKRYKAQVVQTLGEKKEHLLRSEVAKTKMEEVSLVESNEELGCLAFDTLTGRYFHVNTVESLRKAENNINKRILANDWVSLNELYSEIGLDPVKLGDELGWCSSDPVDLGFTSMIASNGQPCLVMDYLVEPKTDYYRNI